MGPKELGQLLSVASTGEVSPSWALLLEDVKTQLRKSASGFQGPFISEQLRAN